MIQLLCHPRLVYLYRAQALVAIPIYFYAALKSSGGGEPGLLGPTALHFLGNVLLCLSLGLATQPKLISTRTLVIILFFLATLVETLQYFNPSRQLDPMDYLVNYLGIVAGLCVVTGFAMFIKKYTQAIPLSKL